MLLITDGLASNLGAGLDDPQRSLPTPTILWLCGIPLQLKHWTQPWEATRSLRYGAWSSRVRTQRQPISTHHPPLHNKVKVTQNHLPPSCIS